VDFLAPRPPLSGAVAALTAIEARRKSREALAGQRQTEGIALADLKA